MILFVGFITVFLSFLYASVGAFSCQSYGVDYVDGGGPYCVNTDSPDYFSFTSYFEGCDSNEGSITPILIDPDENEYFCSDISCVPDDTNMVSTCNVPGNEVLQSQMFSGYWVIVIEGYTFAYARNFSINAQPLQTIIQTPTAIFNVTTTPVTTSTTTSTGEYDTTLPPSTTTVPSATIVKTKTVTPSKVTTTSTKTLTSTKTNKSYTVVLSTATKTATCKTQAPKIDPTCTLSVWKASLLLSGLTTIPSPTATSKPRREAPDRAAAHRYRRSPVLDNLQKRTLDLCTTTSMETTSTISIYNTFTAPTSTVTDTSFTTTTQTITPAPVTVYNGVTTAKVTITAATPTRTINTRTWVTTTTTHIITATIWTATTVTPSGVVCTKT